MSNHVLHRVLRDFPLLVLSPNCLANPSLQPSQCSPFLHYRGYLAIPVPIPTTATSPTPATRHYRIDLHLTPPPKPAARPHLTLRLDSRLAPLLATTAAILQRRWEQCADVHAFLLDVTDIVTQLVAAPGAVLLMGGVRRPASFYRTVVDELAAIGWEHVAAVGEDFTSIELRYTDAAIPHTHTLHLTLPLNYPVAPPTAKADLPLPLPVPPASSSLSAIYAAFASLATSLSSYCAVLLHIDRTLLVLDPTPPTLATPTRRLRLSPTLLCQLTLTPPTNPLSTPPQLQFLGDKAEALRLAWHAHTSQQPWQAPASAAALLAAIEAAIGVGFSRAVGGVGGGVGGGVDEDGDEVVEGACICCWEWRGEAAGGREPDVRCERCGAVYHGRCLYETLSALPTTQLVYDMCFGKCINCQQSLAVPVQSQH